MADDAQQLAKLLAAQVADEGVRRALGAVRREIFVPPAQRGRAYENSALPIGSGQTISQPVIVARMTEVLEITPDDEVLDVGTGSGYHAAVIAQLADHVMTIERLWRLSSVAIRSLAASGTDNVTCLVGDVTCLVENLPGSPRSPMIFDAINVAAAAEGPVLEQIARALAPGGRLVAPLRQGTAQNLVIARRPADGGPCSWRILEPVRFVPLVSGSQAR